MGRSGEARDDAVQAGLKRRIGVIESISTAREGSCCCPPHKDDVTDGWEAAAGDGDGADAAR